MINVKHILGVALLTQVFFSYGQVFNHGSGEIFFRNMLQYGITYSKCDNNEIDSTVIAALEEHWTVSDFQVIERLGRPDKKASVLFFTKKDRTKKYFQDRKNPNVLVLYPAMHYKLTKDDVNMDQCLGYMFYDGFFELLPDTSEHLFIHMMISSLNEGLTRIKENSFKKVGDDLNNSVSESINTNTKYSLGNTLLIHRELTRKVVDMEKVKKAGIRHRLIGQDEFYDLIKAKDKTHYVLYFSKNRFSEISIINIATGQIVYTKHFFEDYPSIKPKEYKEIAAYFK